MAANNMLDLIISEFAAFRYYSRLVLELPTEFGSTIVPDVRLITLREFASGFDFWTRGHLRMATIHLLAKHGANNKLINNYMYAVPRY